MGVGPHGFRGAGAPRNKPKMLAIGSDNPNADRVSEMRVLTASLLAALTATPLTQQQPPAVPTRLALDVVAVGRDGAPVTDLRPEEFEVWISGYRVPVEEVALMTPETSPRTIVLLLDNAAVGVDLAPRVKETARAFVGRMGETDRISVMPVHGTRTDSVGDPARLMQAIDSYRVQGFPFRIEDAGEHVLRLMTAISRQFVEAPGRRKAIVAIGAGWLFDTPLPPPSMRDLHADWLTAMRGMAAANVSLYVIDPVGLRPMAGYSLGGDSGFAHETGGYAFLSTNDLRGAAERIFAEAGTYYVLRMTDPPVQRTADLREVKVRVLRKDVTVRARRGVPGKR
jgi:VWFA-related protein